MELGCCFCEIKEVAYCFFLREVVSQLFFVQKLDPRVIIMDHEKPRMHPVLRLRQKEILSVDILIPLKHRRRRTLTLFSPNIQRHRNVRIRILARIKRELIPLIINSPDLL